MNNQLPTAEEFLSWDESTQVDKRYAISRMEEYASLVLIDTKTLLT